jgi:capsular exopolysaccharide synthesis family protein
MELKDYLRALRRRWLLVLTGVLVFTGGAVAFAWTRTPTYTTHTQLFVSTTSAPGDATQTYEGGLFAQQRVLSYTSIVASVPVVQGVINELGLPASIQQVQGKISASVPSGTVLINVSVTDRSAQLARAIARALDYQFSRYVDAIEIPQAGQQPVVRVTVTNPPPLPSSPSSPRKAIDVAIGVLLGLIVGVGGALLRDALDSRIRDEKEVATVAAAPVLGSIVEDPKASTRPLVVLEDPHSIGAEAYRRLRTNVHAIAHDRAPHSFLISSALPGEGKTLIAANLGLAFAQGAQRVVLVNADLRRPTLGRVLGIASRRGLSNVVMEDLPVEEVLQSHGRLPLELLDSGPLPPDPGAMLGSVRFADVMSSLAERADVVIVDAPALLPVADSAVVAQVVAGVVLVAALGATRKTDLERALRSLDTVDAPVLGVVLNRVSRGQLPRYLEGERAPNWAAPPAAGAAERPAAPLPDTGVSARRVRA